MRTSTTHLNAEILRLLKGGRKRWRDLELALVPGKTSSSTLSHRLKDLENEGKIVRRVNPRARPAISYYELVGTQVIKREAKSRPAQELLGQSLNDYFVNDSMEFMGKKLGFELYPKEVYSTRKLDELLRQEPPSFFEHREAKGNQLLIYRNDGLFMNQEDEEAYRKIAMSKFPEEMDKINDYTRLLRYPYVDENGNLVIQVCRSPYHFWRLTKQYGQDKDVSDLWHRTGVYGFGVLALCYCTEDQCVIVQQRSRYNIGYQEMWNPGAWGWVPISCADDMFPYLLSARKAVIDELQKELAFDKLGLTDIAASNWEEYAWGGVMRNFENGGFDLFGLAQLECRAEDVVEAFNQLPLEQRARVKSLKKVPYDPEGIANFIFTHELRPPESHLPLIFFLRKYFDADQIVKAFTEDARWQDFSFCD